jgi:rare lipoprotein A
VGDNLKTLGNKPHYPKGSVVVQGNVKFPLQALGPTLVREGWILAVLVSMSANLLASTRESARHEVNIGPGGLASWYGETHRGRLMANGKRFNPEELTAASWFYPLGAKVRVTSRPPTGGERSVEVTITDRGPARQLVRQGRIIDLSEAAFRKIGLLSQGLIPVRVHELVPETSGRPDFEPDDKL